MAYQKIRAEYPGFCIVCGINTYIGDTIWWAQDRPISCEECGPCEQPVASPVGGTQATTATERETGEERTRRKQAEQTATEIAALKQRVLKLEGNVSDTMQWIKTLYARLGEPLPKE